MLAQCYLYLLRFCQHVRLYLPLEKKDVGQVFASSGQGVIKQDCRTRGSSMRPVCL